MNDLWKFRTNTLTFELVAGSTALNHQGNYGTMGVKNPANMPPSRGSYAMAITLDNVIWVFGGKLLPDGPKTSRCQY